ncbi:MAG: hypothetical protein R6W67_08025 [Bacteroidales bacterium]
MKSYCVHIVLFILLFFSCFITTAGASPDTISTGSSYHFWRLITYDNPWLNQINPAGLSKAGFISSNRAVISYGYSDKDLIFSQEPGLINSYLAYTEGYTSIGNVSFYGAFGYHNEHYDRLKYNNTLIFDPSNPYLLGDTIGGRQRKEGYSLEGSVSVTLSERISAGLSVHYINSTGAKQKDPRNLNRISSLFAVPGVTFSTGNLTFGLSAGLERFNNDVMVSVTENAKYNLFQFMGLGYFKSIRNIYSYSNAYYGSGYRADFQLGFEKPRFSSFTSAGVRSYTEEVRYGNAKRLLDALSETTSISVYSIQTLKGSKSTHNLEIDFRANFTGGAEINQDYVRIVQGLYSYDSLVTLSWVDNRHSIDNLTGRLHYRLVRANKSDSQGFEAIAGVAANYFSSKHFPVENWGFFDVVSLTGNVGFTIPFTPKRGLTLIPDMLGTYRMSLYKDMEYNVQSQSLPEVASTDYQATHYDYLRGDISLTSLINSGKTGISEYYIKIDYYRSQPVVSGDITGRNTGFNLLLGIIF